MYFLARISWLMLRRYERPVRSLLLGSAVVVGATGAAAFPLIGNTSNDWITAIFVLGGLFPFTEAGIIGYACATARETDDLHFFSDCFGLVQRPRPVGGGGLEADGFLFTSLLPTAPKILLNVESGDYGILDRRPCECALGTAGLTTHISRVPSFEKLSGEGMTFVQTDILRVLEEVLPARFGGSTADYQIVEEETRGVLRLSLVVSPRIGDIDEERVRRTFLQEVGRDGAMTRAGARVWQRADTVVVKRQWPRATRAGKILPFEVLSNTTRPRNAGS